MSSPAHPLDASLLAQSRPGSSPDSDTCSDLLHAPDSTVDDYDDQDYVDHDDRAERAAATTAAAETLAGVMLDAGERAAQLVDRSTTVLCLASVMSTQLGDVSTRAAGVALEASTIASRSRDAAQAVTEIRALVDEARAAVQALGDTAQDIGRISSTLQRMALETRMVGLNAAIEAARAGAAGAGFAVVADKVRELADGANAASEQIIARLTAVRDSAVRSAAVMQRVGDDVGAIDLHAVDIARAAAQQEVGIAEIASGLSGATRSVDEIVKHVEDVTETGMALSDRARLGEDALQVLRSNADRAAAALEEDASAPGDTELDP
jgi:methyl-accepting chemotaxis protein